MAEYNFNHKLDNDRYIVEIDSVAHYGYFQNNRTGTEGGLWFNEKMELQDYDGVFELSKYVIEMIEAMGFNADYAKDDEA